jgi:hypothetical protein
MTARTLKGKEPGILMVLNETRYATIEQVNGIVGTPTEVKYIGKLLDRLYRESYVQIRKRRNDERKVYFLWTRGKHWLIDQGLATPEELKKTAGVKGGLEHPIPHDLSLTDIFVHTYKQACELGYSFTWLNTRQVKLLYPYYSVEPDAWMSLGGSETTIEAFCEFTDDVYSASIMRQKLGHYGDLWRDTKPLPILWFTTSLAKRRKLAMMIKDFAYKDYVYLGLMEDVGKYLKQGVFLWQGKEKQRWLNA